jgi:hypothetical protein
MTVPKALGALPWIGLSLFAVTACTPGSWDDSDRHYRSPRYGYDDYYYRDRYDGYRPGSAYSAIERAEWERRQYWLLQQERELAAERARLERERRELERERRRAAQRQREQEQPNKTPEQKRKRDLEKKPAAQDASSTPQP